MARKKAKQVFASFEELRVDRNFTQTELARRVGISVMYISYIESGQRKEISLSKMNKLAKELNVTLDDLNKLINKE